MSTLYYESSFAHHGIKGQKWGVRRTPEQLGHFRKPSNLGSLIVNKYHNLDGLNVPRMNDSYLEKGTKLYRVSSNRNETGSNRKYVAFTPVDINTYADSEYFPSRYQYEYTLTKDIKIAGGPTAFNAKILTNDKLANTKIEDLRDEDYTKEDIKNSFSEYYGKTMNDIDQSFTNKKSANDFMNDFGWVSDSSKAFGVMESSKANKKYFEKLKSMGYDAVIDMEDAYSQAFSEFPLILLDDKSYEITAVNDRKKNSFNTGYHA